MSKAIERLSLLFFRGASGRCEIQFDTTKPIVMIFGENGTGKSTIADAIDFVANGTLGSLELRSVGSSKCSFLPTIDKKASELKVEVTAGGQCRTGTLSKGSVNLTGGDSIIHARVLRRTKLLQLVEAQPAERYKVLQSFIDVAKVESSEQALRDAVRGSQTDLDRSIAILSEATAALDVLWKQEGSTGSDAETWAKDKSQADTSMLRERAAHLEVPLKLLESLPQHRNALDTALRTEEVRIAGLDAVNKEIAKLPAIGGAQAVQLVELLQQAQGMVALPNDPKTCPVCEKPVSAGDLRKSISDRLSNMTSHQALAKKRGQAGKDLLSAQMTYCTAASNYIKAVRDTAIKIRGNKHTPAVASAIHWQKYEAFLKYTADGDEYLPDAEAIQKQLDLITPAFRTDLQFARADLNQYNAIKGHFERIIANRTQATCVDALLKRMKHALQICEDLRKEFTQSVLNAVEGEMNRLYSIIHPNEPLGPLRLRMDPAKRGSIEQDATFAGHPVVPPQAYYSESHLDTLGFCVWLALAKRDQPKESIIVLDDVFTSVDGVHLTRIMQLLADVAKDFAQIIITTHYRTWRDRYRLSQGPGLSIQLLELHHWTLQRGICLSGTKLAAQELEALLVVQPLNRQAISSQAGILLEAILDRLTLQYRRRLPRNREGEWTLGDLLASCKKLFDVLAVERMTSGGSPAGAATPSGASTVSIAIQPFFKDAGPLMFIRNQVGCHFNFTGAEVADADVEAFGKATLNLVKALTCSDCGDIPDRPDGTHFRCGCKQTKMTPLECDK